MQRRAATSTTDATRRVDRFQLLAVVLLCLAPLAVVPGGENRFVFAKIAVFAAAVGVSCLAAGRGRLPLPVAWLLLGGFALTALSAALGSNPLDAIVGAAPRYEGLPVLALYAGCGWAGARLLGPATGREAALALEWSLSFTAVAIAFIAILETVGLRPLSSNVARPGSLLGSASDQGALGVLIAGTLGWIVLRRFGTGRNAWVGLVGAAAASVAVALSASRAALLGLAVAAAVLAIASPPRRRVALVAAVVAVAVVTLIAPGSRGRVTGSSPLATATVHGRLLLWQETLGLIGHHAAIGIGPGVYVDAITAEHDLRWQQKVGPSNPPDSAHDWVLQVASVGGIALLLLVAAICALVGRSGWTLMRAPPREDPSDARGAIGVGACAGLAGYGVALLFGFTTPGTTPLAAALGGIVLAQPPVASGVAPGALARLPSLARWFAATGATALFALAIMGSVAEVRIHQALDSAATGNLSAADSAFRTAAALRAWDPSVDETAGHAFVVVAQSGGAGVQRAAAAYAGYWMPKAARRLIDDEQVEIDQAALAELHSDYARAETLLKAVLARDRQNPAVLLRLGVVEGESGALREAAATFLEVTRIDPTSPDPWADLAIVYRLEGRTDLASEATAEAQRRKR